MSTFFSGAKSRPKIQSSRDLEGQRQSRKQSPVGDYYGGDGEYYDDYGTRITRHEQYHGSPVYDYHGWTCSPRNLCWGLLWLIGFAIFILGAIGFVVALINAGAISALQTDVAGLTMAIQTLQSMINSLLVPFTHTAAGPLQTGVKEQYIEVAAAAAMTLPGDLSAYINQIICLTSKTAFAHTLTLGAGATFDGVNTVATLGGAVGDGFCFQVFSSTQVQIRSLLNVAFA